MKIERRTELKFDRRKDMNKKLENEIKDYLHLAVQSGKAESSGLVAEVLRQMSGHIKVEIKEQLNDHIIEIKTKLEDYIESDNAWKKRYEPYIEGLANISGGAKIFVWICGGITALSTALIALKILFK